MSLLESNLLYPFGQCDACGWGLTEQFVCQNEDCMQHGLPGCHLDCGPILAVGPFSHIHLNEDGRCLHANPNRPAEEDLNPIPF